MGKKEKDKGLKYHANPSSQAFFGQPDDVFDMVNQYGTYEIQRTADTGNVFPMIAQGLPKAWNGKEWTSEELSSKKEKS